MSLISVLQRGYIWKVLSTSVANMPDRSTLRASSCGNLVVSRTCWRIGNRVFSVAAPRAWNKLPTKLKLLQSTDLFRRDLKTFLFHSVYGHQDTDWLCDVPSSLLVGAQYKCLSYSNNDNQCSTVRQPVTSSRSSGSLARHAVTKRRKSSDQSPEGAKRGASFWPMW